MKMAGRRAIVNVADAIIYFIAGADITIGETLILDGGFHLNQVPLMRR